jgi:SET domain-containing protein
MNNLIYNPKIKVRKSKIHGYGVFAIENIKQGEILEECHFMSIGPQIWETISRTQLARYVFNYPKQAYPKECAWPLGNGCIYNSSPTPNADWNTDVLRRLFIFVAIKDIKKGEEICTNYEENIAWTKSQNLI